MTVVWRDRAVLERPVLVVALEGWFDVAQAATEAVRHLGRRYDATEVASIDAEDYFDFTARRPDVRLVGGDRVIVWPANDCLGAPTDGIGRDLLLLAGIEPHLRWRSFCGDLVEIIRATGTELVITVGALADAVPHTRPAMVRGSSTNSDLADRLGLDRPSYQGPTGLIGVLHDRLDREDIPVISLRVAVPHYVANAQNPRASQALLLHLERVTGIRTGHADLDERITEWAQQVDRAVAEDSEVAAYVRRLEAQADARLPLDLPSGDDLAAEVERFLREQHPDE